MAPAPAIVQQECPGCCGIACPLPSSGKNSVRGRIVDLEIGVPIEIDVGSDGSAVS